MASILFHDPRLSSVAGGGETVTLQLASLFAAAGHSVTILTREAPRTALFADTIRELDRVRVVELPMVPPSTSHPEYGDLTRSLWNADRLAPESITFNVAARSFYQEQSFDLVVVSFALDLAGLNTNNPVLFNVFGLPPDPLIACQERPLLKKCSYYTFASRYVCTEFSRLFDLDANDANANLGPVIYASLSSVFFDPPTPNGNSVDVCYAGRLVDRKGLDSAIEALAWLKANRSLRVRMAIAGNGPRRPSLHARAAKAGVGDQIEWLGDLTTRGVVDLLDRSRVFLYPTVLPEAFGCSNLEAMARGLVVITTNLGGTAEYVIPDVNALVCEPGDSFSLGHCIDLAGVYCEQSADTGKGLM